MRRRVSLLLFSTDTAFIPKAVQAGIESIIVDWENIGKERRQVGAQTEINTHTLKDLVVVRACTDAHLLCRINHIPSSLAVEIEAAISGGADEILLPMVRSVEEVLRVLDLVNGRCQLGILIETVDAVNIAHELGQLPLSRIYVGLNDLSIERRTPNLFSAVADGTVEAVRRACRMPFGFAGVTLPDKGSPIQCSLLIREMARLDCEFTFLRRSFMKDIQHRNIKEEIPRIQGTFEAAFARNEESVISDHQKLLAAIQEANSVFLSGWR